MACIPPGVIVGDVVRLQWERDQLVAALVGVLETNQDDYDGDGYTYCRHCLERSGWKEPSHTADCKLIAAEKLLASMGVQVP